MMPARSLVDCRSRPAPSANLLEREEYGELAVGTIKEENGRAARAGAGMTGASVVLGNGDRVPKRHVPYVLHTGYTDVHEACRSGIVVPKPAAPGQLLSAIEKLLQG
jgi:hypothetical protein